MRYQKEDLEPLAEMHPPGASHPRLLRLPALSPLPTPLSPGRPACRIYSYSACKMNQLCAELPIEGCVQGAFTWAFVESLTAGHFDMSVHQHNKALQRIV